MEPELIVESACHIGEAPLWHPLESLVYWTDIVRGLIYRFDPMTNQHDICYQGDSVGGMTVQEDGSLLLFMAKGAIAIWKERKLEYVIDEIPRERESRFNDVIADHVGRVICGTMPTKNQLGRLYRLDVDGSMTTILEEVGLSNGMGFTIDGRHMYHTDSIAGKIYIYDYCRESGYIANGRVFVDVPKEYGLPDGMTVDSTGCIWSARWGGGLLVKYTPEGKEELNIAFPVRKVSSVTFGGNNLSEMYVTTAGGNDRSREGINAGSLFRLKPGVCGVPEFPSRIGI